MGWGIYLARADVWIILFLVVLVISLSSCMDDDDCGDVKSRYGEASNEFRQCQSNQGSGSYRGSSGSSYGGYNSGGYHK